MVFCFGLAIASAVGQCAGARQTALASERAYPGGAKTKDHGKCGPRPLSCIAIDRMFRFRVGVVSPT